MIEHPASTNDDFVSAATALFQAAPDTAGEEILSSVEKRPVGLSTVLTALLPVLAAQGERAAVLEVGRRLLTDPGMTLPELTAVVRAWLDLADFVSARDVLGQIEKACTLSASHSLAVAKLLTELGHESATVPLWCRLCTTPGNSVQSRWNALGKLLDMGAEKAALQALEGALIVSEEAETLTLKRLLAWAAAS